eukprot:4238474-Amphidinium_carterae.1
MKPTWNNSTQPPTEFIKTFRNWRDEIYNYEQALAELPSVMKMTLLIQNIQGDIKSHLLLTQNLATASFDDSCMKVEDYCRNVYIDNNGGQVAGLQKPQKPWKPWKWKPWKEGKGKEKGKDYGKGKGGKDYPQQQPYKGYDKGGKGKYGKPYSKGKGKGKGGYYNYNYQRPKGSYNYGKGKDKGNGGKPQGPPL